MSNDPCHELPGFLRGELGSAERERLHDLLGADSVLRGELVDLALAAGALTDAARLQLPGVTELPPLRPGAMIAADTATRGIAGVSAVMTALVVATDDGYDQAYAATRRAAVDLAARQGHRIILFDRSPELYLVDPYGRDGIRNVPELLGPADADRLGRSYLAQQLREADAAGVQAQAWIARGSGAAALASCQAFSGASQVLLPAKIATPSLADRVRGHTLAAFRAVVPADITLVGEDGRLLAV